MKRALFSEEQIITILKEAEGSAKGHSAMSAARDLGRNVLHLAEHVRRSGGVGDAPAALTRGREPVAWSPTRRSTFGRSGACSEKTRENCVAQSGGGRGDRARG